MSNSRLYDSRLPGNHSVPFQHGPTRKWRDAETGAVMYAQTWRVLAGTMNPLARGSGGPLGGWLSEESQPSHLGCGLLEWERSYAAVPPPRNTGETVTFNLQQLIPNDAGGQDILEYPITTSGVVKLAYFHTLDPSTIPQLKAWRAVKFNDRLYYSGNPPNGSALVLAEDSRIREWKPMIYERAAIYVRPEKFAEQP